MFALAVLCQHTSRRVFPALLLACLVIPGWSQPTVLSERYDNARTGANLSETILNTSNVNVNQFGKLFSLGVDGSIYAQPLYVPNVAVSGKGTHNVVYVATMNDKVYAFDADSNTGSNATPLWTRDYTNAAAGVTAVPITDIVGSNSLNIVGNVGIEGTPVIDLSSNTMYFVVRTKEVSGGNTTYVQRLHAIDIRSGAEQANSPVVIQGSSGGQTFDPKIHNQRVSLAIANGLILLAWGSHEDEFAYHGWIMAYSQATLAQTYIFCVTPSGVQAGVWESGWAPAIDSQQNVYFITGNGTWDGSTNYGESFLKFSTSTGMALQDWFTPDNWSPLNAGDVDLGASGALLIPGTNLVVGGGKSSTFYLLSTNDLGGESIGDAGANQVLNVSGGEIKGGPVYWNRTGGVGPWMYVWATKDLLKAYHFNGATFDTTPVSTSTYPAPNGASPGVLSLSANGSTPGTGILWASIALNQDADHGVVNGVLRAFNADNLSQELWNSLMNPSRDDIQTWPKFSPPVVANGKVYMGSFSNQLFVFGLLSPDFQLSVAPSAAVSTQGSTVNYTVSVAVQSGFNSAVNLSVTGLPSGTNGSFTPSSTITGTASATLTITVSPSVPVGSYPLTITGTSGTLQHSQQVSFVVASPGNGTISIDFVGDGVPMGSSEVAGVLGKAFWNEATGAASNAPLALMDETGKFTAATATWSSDDAWELPTPDQPGSQRMMNGYLDDNKGNPTVVTVAGLSSNGYQVYVYVDGDNNTDSRTGIYQISGSGITTATISATDAGGKNFSGTFTQANNSSGNYVVFSFTGTGFTLTATPNASDPTKRAPLNGIQIVPTGTAADFTLSATPPSVTVTAGNPASYTATVGSLGGFSGAVTLGVSGLPSGATGSFTTNPVNGTGTSTLNITTTGTVAAGTYPLTITGTSGGLQHTASVSLVVTSGTTGSNGAISIDFVGKGVAMGSSEVAGVVAKSNWNQATGAANTTGLTLVDENGATTGATVTWHADNTWVLPVTDQAGNQRMMNGYLDNGSGNATTVTVAGLGSAAYTVYAYMDGDNNSASRTGNYQISGSGIPTTTISATDASGAIFRGTYTQANNTNGNYVVFTFTGTGFTLTATPGTSSDGTKRAPLNGIQIVPQ